MNQAQYQGQQPMQQMQPGNAQYAQQQYNGQYNGQYNQQYNPQGNAQYGNEKQSAQTFDEKFEPRKKFNDPIFAILYIACFIAFTVISAFSLNAFRQQNAGSIYTSSSFTLNSNTAILMGFVIVTAIALAALYFTLARAFTRKFIIITGILQILFGLGTAIYYLYEKQYAAGVIFLVFALFYAFCFWSWRGRIPLATLYLQFTLDVAKKYKSVYIVSFLGTMGAAGFSAWFALTLVAAYAKYSPNQTNNGTGQNPGCDAAGGGCSNAILIIVLIFLTFTAYWVTEFIKNVTHTTIAGVFGAFYYGSADAAGPPKHAAMSSFKRTITYSFGSIALGSLIVALIQLLRQAIDMFTRYEAGQGDMIGAILGCCLQCFVGLLQWAIQWFNKYVYVEIALFGKSYISAAKDTWKLIKRKGIDALINDSLIGNVLNCGATFIGYVTALLAYLYLKFTAPEYNATGGYNIPVMALAFCIGLQIANTAVVPIASGVATLFVCTATNPEILRNNFPGLHAEMSKFYPQINDPVV